MLEEFKRGYNRFKEDKAGERFINLHKRWRPRNNNHLKTAAMVSIGVVLIMAGAFLGFIPGLPGILLAFPGVILLVAQFRWMASALDRSELALRRWFGRTRRLAHKGGR